MKKLYQLFLRICYLFCRFIPIDDRLVVFESEGDFTDNSRVLYEYMVKNVTGYHYVWLVHNKDFHCVSTSNVQFVYHNYRLTSLTDTLVLSKAKYLFYTHGFGNFFRLRKGQIVINLWHGIPIKAAKNSGNSSANPPVFSAFLCLSEQNAPLVAKFLKCEENYAIPLGFPRNDLLFLHKDIGAHNPFVPKGFEGKVIIWMPTYRKSFNKGLSEDNCDTETGLPFLNNIKSLQSFNNFLRSINIFIIIKIHHLQAYNDVFKYNLSNLIFVQDTDILERGLQLYQVLAQTDALLTDYSSVFFDYLLLDRPIGFILDDLETYQEGRGKFLYQPVTDLMAGKHIYDYMQLLEFCKEIARGFDNTIGVRKILKEKMIKYQDGNSCRRIVDYLQL